MNIFYLDSNIDQCARFHCDKHVIKMILESAQILCSVLWVQEIHAPYRPTHLRHPCVLWANESLSNWYWLRDLACALNTEYRYRFDHNKNHRSYEVILTLATPPLMDVGLTKRPQVLPDEFKRENPIEAYRAYYRICKNHLGYWTKRDKPHWFVKNDEHRKQSTT